MQPVARVTGSRKLSVQGYEVRAEPSESSGTPRSFRRKLALLLMLQDQKLLTLR